VNFLMTYSSDWASGLAALSQGGVHVKVYQPNAPIYIHAKALTVNDDTAYEGSANFTTALTDQNRNVGIITKIQEWLAGSARRLRATSQALRRSPPAASPARRDPEGSSRLIRCREGLG
jgi:phosphatidylserine/phosphatidylglycerophosphate/cardiolipin synthase-like enzyme